MSKFSYIKLDVPLETGIKYEKIDHIDIRGFVLRELREISGSNNVDEWTLQDIISYYKDVIIPRDSEDNIVSINELAEDDLYILMFFVNTLTNKNHKKTFYSKCPECESDDYNIVEIGIGDLKFKKINGAMTVPIIKNNYKIKIVRNLLKDITSKQQYYTRYSMYSKETIDLAFNIDVTEFEFEDELKELKEKLKLDRITEKDDKIMKSLVFLDNIILDDLDEIISTIDSLRIKMEDISIKCKTCGHVYENTIRFRKKDYLPKSELKEYNRLRTLYSD